MLDNMEAMTTRLPLTSKVNHLAARNQSQPLANRQLLPLQLMFCLLGPHQLSLTGFEAEAVRYPQRHPVLAEVWIAQGTHFAPFRLFVRIELDVYAGGCC